MTTPIPSEKLNRVEKIINQQFSSKPPSSALMKCMIDRFKPYKIEGFKNDCRIVEENVMDVLDFLLALNFLARIVYDKKLKLIFEICDDDDDGCMTSEDILSML